MADPRFFENLGPFTLAQICEKSGIALPAGADRERKFLDLADLAGAGAQHVTFFSGGAALRDIFRRITTHKHFDRVWMTTPGAIADHCRTLTAGIVPGS